MTIKKFTNDQEIEICGIYFRDRLSFRQLAKRFQCSRETIRNTIHRQSLNPRTLSEARSEKLGELSPSWKGGKKIHSDGYICIHTPKHPNCASDGYVFEHRLVMERHLNRFLNPEEVIHHINGNRSDNRIENLMLFGGHKDHFDWHKTERRETKLLKGDFII